MIILNLKFAIRNLLKNGSYSVINIAGLAVGLAAFILISLYIHFHFNFDKGIPDVERIYRVDQTFKSGGTEQIVSCTPFPLRVVLEEQFPEIVSAARMQFCGEFLSTDRENTHRERNGRYVEQPFLEMFNFKFVKGNRENALTEKQTIVLSERLASKYFGNENPVGQIIKLMNGLPCQITGVYADQPQNVTLRPDYLVSYTTLHETLQPDIETNWDWCMSTTFIKLDENASPNVLEDKIANILANHSDGENENQLSLWPYSIVHLQFNRDNDRRGMLYLLVIIAFFILLIASINFANLSTAYSTTRAKEIALRKVSGAFKVNILQHFLSESVVISVASFLLALLLANLMLPSLNGLMQENLVLFSTGNIGFLLLVFGVAIALGLLAGCYPALFLSNIPPDRAMKGSFSISSGNPFVRKVLVVFQFFISIGLIVCTLATQQQLNHMRNMELGFDSENMLVGYLQLTGDNNEGRYNALKNDLLSDSRVLSMSWAHNAPFFTAEWWRVNAEGMHPDDRVSVQHNHIDFDFLNTFGIEIVEGRDLSPSFPTDSIGAALVSLEAVRQFGWGDEALGKRIVNDNDQYIVVGVMEDFHMFSVARPIDPQFFTYTTRELSWPNTHAIKIAKHQDPVAMKDFVTKKFWEYFPDDNIEFQLLDEGIEDRNLGFIIVIGTLMGIFAFLAISIATVGLFSLVAFITKQRTKEIGIRKVNGAQTYQLIGLISKEFVILLVIANIIALPASYYLTGFIINNFAYRISLGPTLFLVAAICSFLITMLTIGFQIIKASNANPIESLRFE